ncbi:MAG: aminotransferase class I/II-fold pyridoxal phosphate-dependent enzyme [Rhodospirillales bacterium]|nr:aminotransferase class I/II-fold pyridoxal phosphate-dependent enzyme [Rhodospirillales bacterium]MBI2586809.1 aminotransferase class I/II-fold pyridoxal phosphate-dependent enzyme [Rhodospirillales bacterium]
MVLKVAKRGAIPPFIVMDVMRAANEREAGGEGVLHLEVGQPGTSAPKAVLEAARTALFDDRIGYTEATGLPALRRRIAAHYRDVYGVTVELERVIVTTGSSGGFVLSFLAAFEAGDRVALASPGYPAYRNILRAVGVEVVDLQTGPETNFQPTPELLDRAARQSARAIDGLIIASPSNPTGTMIHAGELKAIVDYCEDRGIRLISDEIYHGITYGELATTVLAHTAKAIVVNSFSKYFSMTGWRIGWMVVPPDLCRSVECLAQNFFISPPTLSQFAALKVFDCRDELDANVVRYAENRALLLEQLPKAGFRKLAPAEGAFYIYADVAHMTNDSQEFCKRMLAETGVAATPGIDFDPGRGHRFMRFCFAGEHADMAEAADRLRRWRR